MNRRTLFKRLLTMAGIIAIAPKIAFAELPPIEQKLDLNEIFELVYKIALQRGTPWPPYSRIEAAYDMPFVGSA